MSLECGNVKIDGAGQGLHDLHKRWKYLRLLHNTGVRHKADGHIADNPGKEDAFCQAGDESENAVYASGEGVFKESVHALRQKAHTENTGQEQDGGGKEWGEAGRDAVFNQVRRQTVAEGSGEKYAGSHAEQSRRFSYQSAEQTFERAEEQNDDQRRIKKVDFKHAPHISKNFLYFRGTALTVKKDGCRLQAGEAQCGSFPEKALAMCRMETYFLPVTSGRGHRLRLVSKAISRRKSAMQETLQDIKTRRSCRKYQPRQITDEELAIVLEAGTWAASGRGAQSPLIVAVQDKDTIARLSRMNAEIMGTQSDPFYGAPTVLVVLADPTRPTYREDASLVIGNLMLAAHAIGLGSCWIHRAAEEFTSEEGKELLRRWGIEGEYRGVGHCILGYAAEGGEAPARPRKKGYVVYVK